MVHLAAALSCFFLADLVALEGGVYDLGRLTDGETEAQRGGVAVLRPQSERTMGRGLQCEPATARTIPFRGYKVTEAQAATKTAPTVTGPPAAVAAGCPTHWPQFGALHWVRDHPSPDGQPPREVPWPCPLHR